VESETGTRGYTNPVEWHDAEQQGAGGVADAIDDDAFPTIANRSVFGLVSFDRPAVILRYMVICGGSEIAKPALGSTSSVQYDACPAPPKKQLKAPSKHERLMRRVEIRQPDFALILLRLRLPFGRTAMGNNCTPNNGTPTSISRRYAGHEGFAG
jgi:hypothetical protein